MIYLFLSFLAGIIIVINIMLNGRIAQREGMINGIMINFLLATISSILMCTLMVKAIPLYSEIRTVPLLYYIGGFIGVLTTFLFNMIVPKIPALYIVILRFIGQLLTSVIIDYLYFDFFSKGKLIGGLLFFVGLLYNAKVDSKDKQENFHSYENS